MPIVGLGTDIVEIARFAPGKLSKRFLNAVFTELEQEYCTQRLNPAQHFAARFAAKEAAAKALSSTLTFVSVCQIEVYHDINGIPCLRLIDGRHGEPAPRFTEGGRLLASLSHSEHYAVATVIYETE